MVDKIVAHALDAAGGGLRRLFLHWVAANPGPAKRVFVLTAERHAKLRFAVEFDAQVLRVTVSCFVAVPGEEPALLFHSGADYDPLPSNSAAN